MTAQPSPLPLIVIDIDSICIHSDVFCIIIDMKTLPVIYLFFHIRNRGVYKLFSLLKCNAPLLYTIKKTKTKKPTVFFF